MDKAHFLAGNKADMQSFSVTRPLAVRKADQGGDLFRTAEVRKNLFAQSKVLHKKEQVSAADR